MTRAESIYRPTFQEVVRDTLAFCAHYPTLAAFIGLGATVLCALIYASVLPEPALVAEVVPALIAIAACSAAGLAALSQYHRRLHLRIHALQNGVQPWKVYVNGVCVGELADALYAMILRDAHLDARLYRRQVGQVLSQLLRAGAWLAVLVPLLAFWGCAALFVFWPEGFTQVVSALRTATPAELVANARGAQVVLALVSFFVFLVLYPYLWSRLPESCFQAEINRCVRMHVRCAADGRVWLSQSRADAQRVSSTA